MKILEAAPAQEILADAVLSQEDVEELAGRLGPFLGRYLPLFKRSEQRVNARLILEGKLSSLSRKTPEPIAHHFGVRRENLQDFLGASPWEDDRLLAGLRQHITQEWGDPQGVLTGDTSGFPKKGAHSCGVKRQYCGRLGKVDNCQVGVFLGYACRRGHALLDHRLFLPKEWADDPARREETGVPRDVVFKETWEVLLDEVDRCKGVPHSWLAADSEFGKVYAFRQGLRQRGERYVVDVPSTWLVRDLRAEPPRRQHAKGPAPKAPFQNIEAWLTEQPAAAWQRFEVRAGEKGPLLVEAVETRAQTLEDGRLGDEERLVVIRTAGKQDPKTWCTFSNASDDVPLADVVWAHAQRHWEEAALKEGKSEVGMGEYEVRGWRGWHHHMTMSLLALWFLASERDRVKKNSGDNGECVEGDLQQGIGFQSVDLG
jgi:SRSO17 transposase